MSRFPRFVIPLLWAIVAVLSTIFLVGCSESPTSPSTIDSISLLPSHSFYSADVSARDISCSDAAPRWAISNFSTDRSSYTVSWVPPALDGYTYEVSVHHSRDGSDEGAFVYSSRPTTRSEATMDGSRGGRFYLKVRIIHNPCGDVQGAWSDFLTVYTEGSDSTGKHPPIGFIEQYAMDLQDRINRCGSCHTW